MPGNNKYEIRKIKKPTKNVRSEAWVWKEVKQAQKKVMTAYHPNQNTIIITIIIIIIIINNILFYEIRKKYNEIQLTKNKNGLKQLKNEYYPTKNHKCQSIY